MPSRSVNSAEVPSTRCAFLAKATYSVGKTTKRMFRRVSTKFSDNTIPTLKQVPRLPPREIHNKADILADARCPIFPQHAPSSASIDRVRSWINSNGQDSSEKSTAAEEISTAEVAAVVAASKAGNACGPDRLGNDWYRDYADEFIPILTRLYNLWFDKGIFADYFLEADIFCLKKSGDTSNPLNYRPLTLLNSDYKLFTRVLATRVSKTIPDEIRLNQNGFVPGRKIRETVDLFDVAQIMAELDCDESSAIALLVDFQKAYDSLSRDYLIAVLKQQGYPARFVEVVHFLYSGIKVRFIVNGAKSRLVLVTSGIRQGCRLASLLFVLTLDPFHRCIDSNPGLRGIRIRVEFELRVGGYADDTVAYLHSHLYVSRLLILAGIFGNGSGLRLNEAKMIVVALHPSRPLEDSSLPPPLRYQPRGTYGRYLGLQVGSNKDAEVVWTKAEQTTRYAT